MVPPYQGFQEQRCMPSMPFHRDEPLHMHADRRLPVPSHLTPTAPNLPWPSVAGGSLRVPAVLAMPPGPAPGTCPMQCGSATMWMQRLATGTHSPGPSCVALPGPPATNSPMMPPPPHAPCGAHGPWNNWQVQPRPSLPAPATPQMAMLEAKVDYLTRAVVDLQGDLRRMNQVRRAGAQRRAFQERLAESGQLAISCSGSEPALSHQVPCGAMSPFMNGSLSQMRPPSPMTCGGSMSCPVPPGAQSPMHMMPNLFCGGGPCPGHHPQMPQVLPMQPGFFTA